MALEVEVIGCIVGILLSLWYLVRGQFLQPPHKRPPMTKGQEHRVRMLKYIEGERKLMASWEEACQCPEPHPKDLVRDHIPHVPNKGETLHEFWTREMISGRLGGYVPVEYKENGPNSRRLPPLRTSPGYNHARYLQANNPSWQWLAEKGSIEAGVTGRQ